MNRKVIDMRVTLSLAALALSCVPGIVRAQDIPQSRGGRDLIGTDLPSFKGVKGLTWLNTPDRQPPDIANKVVFIRLWNRECPSCEETAPAIRDLYERFPREDVAVIAIYYPGQPGDINRIRVLEAAEELGLKCAIGFDERRNYITQLWLESGERKGNPDEPEHQGASFVIDHLGKIRYVHPGGAFFPSQDPGESQANGDYEEIRAAITALVGDRADWVARHHVSSMKQMQVAAVQVVVDDDLSRNTEAIIKAIEEEASQGTRLVVFPEGALTSYKPETIRELKQAQIDRGLARIGDACRRGNIYAVIGSAYPENGKWYNSAFVLAPTGDILKRYDKMHVVLSDFFTNGDRLAIFRVDDVPATVFICHDERYPEILRIPVLAGAKLGIYISCESKTEDKRDNYRCQIIGRAVENQVAIVHSNAGDQGGNIGSHGHSRIIDEKGLVLAEAGGKPGEAIRAVIHPERSSDAYARHGAETPSLKAFWNEGLRVLRQHNPEFFNAEAPSAAP